MSELTKCWLQEAIAGIETIRDDMPFGLDEDEQKTLAALKMALAVLDAQEKPAAYIISDKDDREAGRAGQLSFRGVISYSDDDINEYELLEKPLYTTPPAASAPEGWKLVPIEPTQRMIDAHTEGMVSGGATRAYRDMLEAAPAPGGDDVKQG